jgi:hypothetical protein
MTLRPSVERLWDSGIRSSGYFFFGGFAVLSVARISRIICSGGTSNNSDAIMTVSGKVGFPPNKCPSIADKRHCQQATCSDQKSAS